MKLSFPQLEAFLESHRNVKGIEEIIGMDEHSFIDLFADHFDGDTRKARSVYREAKRVDELIVLLWANIKDTVSSPIVSNGLFNNIRIPPSFIAHQKLIPSYNRLFDNLNYREYDECRTVYGPAAYFVDLMRFVDKHVPQTGFKKAFLSNRRPDLFTLPLNCDNTYTLVSYIDIVNEVLDAVARKDKTSSDKLLTTAKFPMTLPAMLPLESIRLYLSQLNLSLCSIYQLYGAHNSHVSREILILFPYEFDLLENELPTKDDLNYFYGGASLTGKSGLENVQVFLQKTGLSRKELNNLLFSDLTDAEIAAGLARLSFINNTGDGKGQLYIQDRVKYLNEPGYVSQYPVKKDGVAGAGGNEEEVSAVRFGEYDVLHGLSERKLDRIYRFVKLARKLKWTFSDLDWAIRSFQNVDSTETVLQFDGVNDFVEVRNAGDILSDKAQVFTLEAWVSPSRKGIHPILSKCSAADKELKPTYFSFWITPEGKLAFFTQRKKLSGERNNYFKSTLNFPFEEDSSGDIKKITQTDDDADAYSVVGHGTVPVGSFSHVAVTVNKPVGGKFELTFYINGKLDSTWTLKKAIEVETLHSSNTVVYIGKHNSGHFSGQMADVRIWGALRSLNDIKEDRFQRLHGRETNLVAYWPLVESVDMLCHDFVIQDSGNLDDVRDKHPGTLGGPSHYSQPIWTKGTLALDPLRRPVSLSYKYFFDGRNTYIGHTLEPVSGSVLAPSKLNITVEAWVQTVGTQPLVTFGKVHKGDTELLYALSVNKNRLAFSLKQIYYEAVDIILSNTLTHVAATMSGDVVELFIDGVKAKIMSRALNSQSSSTAADSYVLYLGRNLSNYPEGTRILRGTLQEVRIWGKVKQPDASRFYQLSGAESDLVGYWRLDDPHPRDEEVVDRTFNENHLSFKKVLAAHEPTVQEYKEVILPDPVRSSSAVLQFTSDGYPVALKNQKMSSLGQNESFSVQLWFCANYPPAADPQLLFGQGESEVGFAIYCVDRKVHVCAWSSNFDGDKVTNTPSSGQVYLSSEHIDDLWHHLTLTYDETNEQGIELRLYLDGEKCASTTDGFRLDSIGHSCLGGVTDNCTMRILTPSGSISAPITKGLGFNGKITDLRIWKVALLHKDLINPATRYHHRHIPPHTNKDLVCYATLTSNYGHSVSDHEGPRYAKNGVDLGPVIPSQNVNGFNQAKLYVGPDDPKTKWQDATRLPIFPDRVLSLYEGHYLRLPDVCELDLVGLPFKVDLHFYCEADFKAEVQLSTESFPAAGFPLVTLHDMALMLYPVASSEEDLRRSEAIVGQGKWSYVSWTYKNMEHSLVVNGATIGSASGTGIVTDGIVTVGPASMAEWRLSELKIWRGSSDSTKSKLAANWNFMEEPSRTIVDRTANGELVALNAIGEGNPWREVTAVPPTFTSHAQTLVMNNPGATDFPGVTPSFVDLGALELNLSGTIELWVAFVAESEVPFESSGVQSGVSIVQDAVLLDASAAQPFLLTIRRGRLIFEVADHSNVTTTVTLPIPAEIGLQHIAAAWKLIEGESVRLDLVLDHQHNFSVNQCAEGVPEFTSPILGLNQTTNFDEVQPFRGKVSQLRIWDHVRSIHDLMRLLEADLEGCEAGLQLCVPFNQSKGSDLSDLVSDRTIKLRPFSPQHPEPRMTDTAWGVKLDGCGSYIRLDNYLPSASGTVEMWVKFSSEGRRIMDGVIFDASTHKAFTLFVEDNRLVFHVESSYDSDVRAQVNLSNVVELAEQFHKIVATWKCTGNRISIALGIDGAQPCCEEKYVRHPWPAFQTLYVGQRCGTFYNWNRPSFKGVFRQLAVWDRPVRDGNAGLLRNFVFREGEGEKLHSSVNDSASIVHGTELSDPWVVLERAVEFSGMSRAEFALETFVKCPNALPRNEGTIELFVQFTKVGPDRVLLDASTNNLPFSLKILGTDLTFQVGPGLVRHALSGENFDDCWHHVVASWKWSFFSRYLSLKLYVDFASATCAELPCASSVEPNNPYLGIARLECETLEAYLPFDGRISEFRVWLREISLADLEFLRFADLSDQYNSLVTYLPFKTAQGPCLLEIISGSYAYIKLGVHPGPTWEKTSPRLFQMDGIRSGVLDPAVWKPVSKTDYSFELFVYLNESSGTQPLLGTAGRMVDADQAEVFDLRAVDGVLNVNINMRARPLIISDLPLSANKWHHVICQYSVKKRQISVVVNGKQSRNLAELAAGAASTPVDRHLFIGFTRSWLDASQSWESISLRGVIAEIRVWTGLVRCDSGAAVRRLRGDEPGLVSNWIFTDSTIRTLVGCGISRVRAYALAAPGQVAPGVQFPITKQVTGRDEQPEIYPSQPAPNLDGYNDYLHLKVTATALELPHTVEFWYRDGAEWEHIAAIYNKNRDLDELFIMGEPLQGELISTKVARLNVLALAVTSGTHPENVIAGQVAELRVWGTRRTEEAIKYHMYSHVSWLAPQLLGYWQLADGSGIQLNDKTENSPSSTLIVGLEDTTEKWQKWPPPVSGAVSALFLDGKDDRVYLEGLEHLHLERDFTLEAWVLLHIDSGMRQPLLGSADSKSEESFVFIGFDEGLPTLKLGNWVNWKAKKGTSLADGDWHHIAWQHNSTSKGKIIVSVVVDSVLVDSSSFSADVHALKGLVALGAHNWDTNKAAHLRGALGRVRLWNSVRELNELTFYGNRQLPGEAAVYEDLIADWIFDDRVDTLVSSDVYSKGNRYFLQWQSDKDHDYPQWTEVEDHPILMNPLVQKALSFDGKQQYAATLGEIDFPAKNWTLEAWIKIHDLSTDRPIIWVGSSSGSAIELKVSSTGNLELLISDSVVLRTGSNSVKANELTHVAAVQDSTSFMLFLNGGSNFNEVLTSVTVPHIGLTLEVGRRGSAMSHHFKGLIQEVRIWDSAKVGLDNDLLTKFYSEVGKADGLVASWSLSTIDAQKGLSGRKIVKNLVNENQPLVLGGPLSAIIPSPGKPSNFIDARRSVLTLMPTFASKLMSDGETLHIPNMASPQHPDRARRFVEVWFYARETQRKQIVYAEKSGDRDDVCQLCVYLYAGELIFETVFPSFKFGQSPFEGESQVENVELVSDKLVKFSIRTRRVQPRHWHRVVVVIDGREELRDNAFLAALDGRAVGVTQGWQLDGHPSSIVVGGLQFMPATGTSTSTVTLERADAGILDGQIAEVRVWEADHDGNLPDIVGSPNESIGSKGNLLWRWKTGELSLPIKWQGAMLVPDLSDNGNSSPKLPLESLAILSSLESTVSNPIFTLCALWSDVRFIGNMKGNLFERTFNPSGASYWSYTDRRVWQVNENENEDREIRNRLLSSLRISSQDDLLGMVHALSGSATKVVVLDGQYLTHLYRIRVLSTILALPISDVLGLIKLLQQRTENKQSEDRAEVKQSISIEDVDDRALQPLSALLKLPTKDTKELMAEFVSTVTDSSQISQPLSASIAELTVQDVEALYQRAEWMRETGIDLAKYRYLVDDDQDARVVLPYTDSTLIDGAKTLNDAARAYLVTQSSFISTDDGVSEGASTNIYAYLLKEKRAITKFTVASDSSADGAQSTALVTNDLSNETATSSLEEDIRKELRWVDSGAEFTQSAGSILLDSNLFEPISFVSTKSDGVQTRKQFVQLKIKHLVSEGFMDANGLVKEEVDGENLTKSDVYSVSNAKLKQVVVKVDSNIADKDIDDEKLVQLGSFLAARYKSQRAIPSFVVRTLKTFRQGVKEAIENFFAEVLATDVDKLRTVMTHTRGRTFELGMLKVEAVLTAADDLTKKTESSSKVSDLDKDLKQLNKTNFLLLLFDLSDDERNELLSSPRTFGLAQSSLVKPTFHVLDLLHTFVKMKTQLSNSENRLLLAIKQLNKSSTKLLPLLKKVTDAANMIKKLGTEASYLNKLANTSKLDLEYCQLHANTLFDLVRAKYSDGQWTNVNKPLHDKLATRKRDVLLAYVLNELSDKLEDRNDANVLYEYLLLDVQTGSEVLTSRIVQANASLQLYVTRCLMNLEPGVEPTDAMAKEWEWMKNFRVWQANRKVFLYPENYIEPELRQAKTPVFDELVDDLKQSDVTEETAAAAYKRYFSKFAQVSNLTIVGSYLDTPKSDQDPEKTLYLVGRNENTKELFYRRWVNEKQWDPWQKITFTINAKFVSPVFVFGRLFLFWAELREEAVAENRRWVGNSQSEKPLDQLGKEIVLKNESSEENLKKASLDKSTGKAIEKARDGTWEVRDPSLNDRAEQINVKYRKPSLHFSYLDNDGEWTQAEALEEQFGIDGKISELNAMLPKWERVYAHRWRNSKESAGKVEAMLVKGIRGTHLKDIYNEGKIESNDLTISFWVSVKETRKQYGTVCLFECDANGTPFSVNLTVFPDEEARDLAGRTVEVVEYVLTEHLRNEKIAKATALIESYGATANPMMQHLKEALEHLSTLADSLNQKHLVEDKSNSESTDDTNDLLTKIKQSKIALTNALVNASSELDVIAEQESSIGDDADAVASNLSDAIGELKAKLTALRQEGQVALRLFNGSAAKLYQRIEYSENFKYGQWYHVAVALTQDANVMSTDLQLVVQDYASAKSLDPKLSAHVKTLSVKKRSDSKKVHLKVAKAVGGNDELDVRMCELRAWNVYQNAEMVKKYRLNVLYDTFKGLKLHEPLFQDNDVSPASDRIDLTVLKAPQVLSTSRERVVLVYGEGIVLTLRNTLKDIGNVKLVDANSQGGPSIVLIKSSTASVGYVSNRKMSILSYLDLHPYDRFLPTNRKILNKAELMVDWPQALEKNVRSWTEGTFNPDSITTTTLLKNADFRLAIDEAYISEVHNQPNWHLLDIGDEIFLVRFKAEKAFGSVESRLIAEGVDDSAFVKSLRLIYTDDKNTTDVTSIDFTRVNTFAVQKLRERLFEGLDSLLSFKSQDEDGKEPDFSKLIAGDPRIEAPEESIFEGPNSIYYQEIFFHIPLLIATQLNANQKFAEAQRWFHYIFNPLVAGSNADEDNNPNDRYWQYKPFRAQGVETIVELLTNKDALEAYRSDPFDPHTIAALRVNTYQKVVVMKYIKNLIDWGDLLFGQDTRESIAEATQLYVLGSTLLGPTPKSKPARDVDPIGSYNDICRRLKTMSVKTLPDFVTRAELTDAPISNSAFNPHSSVIAYFGVPENSEFLGLWSLVEDRLFKIRHSLNINGVFRAVSLFQPTLDPRALVQAAASGVGSFSSALPASQPALPHYRFSETLAKAKTIVETIINFGAALSHALDSRDNEKLTQLQLKQELRILNMELEINDHNVKQAELNVAALGETLKGAQQRKSNLDSLIDEFMSPLEISEIAAKRISKILQYVGSKISTKAGLVSAVPDINVGGSGFGGSPVLFSKFGGSNLAKVLKMASKVVKTSSDAFKIAAEILSKFSEYDRRRREWRQERRQVESEIKEINLRVAEGKSQLKSAQQEMAIQRQQIMHSQQVSDFYTRKFHTVELYSWLANRMSSLYFQAYKIAFDLARKAELAYQFEFGSSKKYLSFGYWDSRRNGLLAGEALLFDLLQLESAAFDQDSRLMEITKTISLATIDPPAFLQLLETGKCQFGLTHLLFDRDFPGHFFRIIKSLEISIPADLGAHETVHATLTQTGHKTLLSADPEGLKYMYGEIKQIPRSVRVDWRANQQIAVSKADKDSGLFKFELDDKRYLPFENTGCVSNWTLELSKKVNRFDFSTIKDVVLHLRYMSSIDNGAFKMKVMSEDKFTEFNEVRVLNVGQSFANKWEAYVNSEEESLELDLPINFIPHNIEKIDAVAETVVSLESDGKLSLEAAEGSLVQLQPLGRPRSVKLTVRNRSILNVLVIIRVKGSLA